MREISFRPLSGTVFPKLDRMRRERKYKARVSVPSRGLYFLNGIYEDLHKQELGFRPLSGTVFPK